jgi:putative zinc finger protein
LEQATLRPVPLRPAGPVDPAEAFAHVLAALPDLGKDAARALSLMEIAGRTRDKAVEEMQLPAEVVGQLLYVARKALRRSIFPLSASGWCERAEHLLSDRIDGVLVPPGPARLDVHLRNCERCVDHERRLAQARDILVRNFIDAHPESMDAGPAERPAPAASLRVVEPVVVETPSYDGPTRAVAGFAGVATEADDGELPVVSFAGPGGQVEIRIELQVPVNEHEHIPDSDELSDDPPLDDDVETAEPADTAPSEHDAEDEEPPVDPAEPAVEVTPASHVWGSLTVLSVAVAVILLAAVVAGLSILT